MAVPAGVGSVDSRGYATAGAYGSLTTRNTWNYEHVQSILGPTDSASMYAMDPRFQQNINIENIYALYNGRSLKVYSLNFAEAVLVKNLNFVQLLFPPRLTEEKTFEFFTSKINLIPHHRIPPGGLPNVFTTSKMSLKTTIESYGLMGHVGLREALDPNYGKEKINEIVYGESMSAVYSIRANALRELIVDGYNNAILGTFGMVSARNNPQDQFLVETQNFAVAAYSKEQFFAMVANATRRIIPAKPGSKHLVIMWPGGRLYLNQSLQPARATDFRAWMSVQDPITMQLFVQDLEVSPEGIQILNNDFGVGWVESPVMRLNATDEDPEYFVTRVCLAEHYAARLVDHVQDEVAISANMSETRLESTTDIALYSIDSDQWEMVAKDMALRAMGIWDHNANPLEDGALYPQYSEAFFATLKEANAKKARPAAYDTSNAARVRAFLSQDAFSYAPDGLLERSLICAYWDDVAQEFVAARNIGQLERIQVPRFVLDRLTASLAKLLMPAFKSAYQGLVQLIKGWSSRSVSVGAQKALIKAINESSVDENGNFLGSLTPDAQVKRFPGALVLVESLRGAHGGVSLPSDATMAEFNTSPDEIIPFCLTMPMLKTITVSRFDGAFSQWKKYGDALQPHLDALEQGAEMISKILPGNSVTDDLNATSPWVHVTNALTGLYQNTIADFNCAYVPIYAASGPDAIQSGNLSGASAPSLVDIVFPDGTRLNDATAANFKFTAPGAYTLRIPGRYGPTLGARIVAVGPSADIVGKVLSLPNDFGTVLALRLTDKESDDLTKRLDRFGKPTAFPRQLALEAAILLASANADVVTFLNADAPTSAQMKALFAATIGPLAAITDAELAELKDRTTTDATLEALRGGGVKFALQKSVSLALTDAERADFENAIRALVLANLAARRSLSDILTQLKNNPKTGGALADAGTYAAAIGAFRDKISVNLTLDQSSLAARGAGQPAFDFSRPVSTYARTPLSVPLAAFNSLYARPDRLVLMSDPAKFHNTFLANGGDAAAIKKNLGSTTFGLIRAFSGPESMAERFVFARALDPVMVNDNMPAPMQQQQNSGAAAPSWAGFASVSAPFGLNQVPASAQPFVNAEAAPMAQNVMANKMFAGPWEARIKEDFATRRHDEFYNALLLCIMATPTTYRAAKSMSDVGLDVFVDHLLVRPSIGLDMYNCVVAATQCGTLFMNPPNVRAAIDVMYQDLYLVSEIYFKAVVDSRDQIQLLPNVAPKGYIGGWNHHLMHPQDYATYMKMAESIRPSIMVIPVPITERVGSILHLNNDDISQNVVNRLNATALQTTQLSSLALIKKIWPDLYVNGARDAKSRILSPNDKPNLDYINSARNVQLLSTRGPSIQRAHAPGTHRQVPGISPLSRPGMQATGAASVWRGAGGEFRARNEISINHAI